MANELRIGIKNENSQKIQVINKIFASISENLKTNRQFPYTIRVEDYELLKKEYDNEVVKYFEEKNIKAYAEWEKEIIVFNDSFFGCIEINQKSVFLHEIGHIVNKPQREAVNNFQNCLVKWVYVEYLADIYLFEVDKNIFLHGRIIPDLDSISINKIKKEIEESNYNENVIKGKFIDVGRLYYYYSLYQYEPISDKIAELIDLINDYFLNIDLILEDLKKVCNELKSKKYLELEDLFNKIDIDIQNLRRNQPPTLT